MNTKCTDPKRLVEPPQKTVSVKIFGVGSAGVSVLELMLKSGMPGAGFVAVEHGRARRSRPRPPPEKIHLETKLLRGLGTGGDPERGRALAEEQLPRSRPLCEGADVVFIVAGLGGGAGSGISPVLARAAKETGALVLAFVTLPFACEGNRRQHQAQQGLARTQGRRRRRHLPAEPENLQVD